MSFLLGALGHFGSQFLPYAGGYLLKKYGVPLIQRMGSYFTGQLAGNSSLHSLGHTVMDRLIDTGLNAAYGGLQKFARSDWLRRKVPILAPVLGDIASQYKQRLEAGVQGAGGGEANGGPPGNEQMDGIERQDYY